MGTPTGVGADLFRLERRSLMVLVGQPAETDPWQVAEEVKAT